MNRYLVLNSSLQEIAGDFSHFNEALDYAEQLGRETDYSYTVVKILADVTHFREVRVKVYE